MCERCMAVAYREAPSDAVGYPVCHLLPTNNVVSPKAIAVSNPCLLSNKRVQHCCDILAVHAAACSSSSSSSSSFSSSSSAPPLLLLAALLLCCCATGRRVDLTVGTSSFVKLWSKVSSPRPINCQASRSHLFRRGALRNDSYQKELGYHFISAAGPILDLSLLLWTINRCCSESSVFSPPPARVFSTQTERERPFLRTTTPSFQSLL